MCCKPSISLFTCPSTQVYLPGQPLAEGEELVHDSSAYHMFHTAQTGAPCLSFDILRDSLGDNRTEYPLIAYLVAGTQAEAVGKNIVILMKMSELGKTKDEDESEYMAHDYTVETAHMTIT